MSEQSLPEGICCLRDKIATMRYCLWEAQGVVSRRELDPEKERDRLFRAVADYPPLDWEYEKSVVFTPVERNSRQY